MATEERSDRAWQAPQIVLYRIAIGHYASRVLHLAAKLGIPDQLKDGPRHFEELARATATHAPSLNRVLRFLVSLGVFAEPEAGKFALTPIGEALRSDVPGSAHAMVMMFAGIQMHDNWKELEHCVRTGAPAFRKRGLADPFAEGSRSPEESAIFDAAMADLTRLITIAIAASYDFTSLGTLVDIGGGNGTLLTGLLHAHSHLRGIVFDLPAASARATKKIDEEKLTDRCQAVAGDFFKEVPGSGDAYLLKHVIHDWDDDRARTILANCRRAMAPTAKLLIIEGVYPARVDQSADSRGAAANDLNMLVNTGGRQRSEAEFRALYDAAGFTLTRIVPTPAPVCVIEGVPA